MNEYSIVIGTPCFNGSAYVNYITSAFETVAMLPRRGVAVQFDMPAQESLVTRARNSIVARFLNDSSKTHLLFIDADIGFRPETIVRFLSFEKDVVCGIYPLKGIDWHTVRKHLNVDEEHLEQASLEYAVVSDLKHVSAGFAKAMYATTGFMLIRRHVFELLKNKYPHLAYGYGFSKDLQRGRAVSPGSTNQFAFFDTSIDSDGNYLSEDYTFCDRWRRTGGDIWVDLTSKFTHFGIREYRGDFLTFLREGPFKGDSEWFRSNIDHDSRSK